MFAVTDCQMYHVWKHFLHPSRAVSGNKGKEVGWRHGPRE